MAARQHTAGQEIGGEGKQTRRALCVFHLTLHSFYKCVQAKGSQTMLKASDCPELTVKGPKKEENKKELSCMDIAP